MNIHVCSICGEVADDSYDYGPSLSCHHDPYQSIEPVEVTGSIVDGELRFPLPGVEEWKATVGAEMIRKQDERAAKRAAWMALTCEERVAKREERLAAMSTIGRLTQALMSDSLNDQRYALNRAFFGGKAQTIKEPCPRCKETECPNARTREIPAWDGTVQVQGRTAKIPLKPKGDDA